MVYSAATHYDPVPSPFFATLYAHLRTAPSHDIDPAPTRSSASVIVVSSNLLSKTTVEHVPAAANVTNLLTSRAVLPKPIRVLGREAYEGAQTGLHRPQEPSWRV